MDSTPMPTFQLSLLGGFELSGPDGAIDLTSKKLAALLAFLACSAPQAHSRDKLMSLLWGSHFDAQARQNLRQALTRLRRVLGDEVLISGGETVSLQPGVIVSDVAQFEALLAQGTRDALHAAVGLYRGRLLADVAISEEAWTEWLGVQRQRLEGQALDGMVKLAEQELQSGHHDQAVRAANRAIEVSSLREDAHRLVMRALAEDGRRADALKHYEDLAALLKRELTVEPDPTTRALAAELHKSHAARPGSEVGSDTASGTGAALPPLPDRPSIAVLPFTNMSSDPEQEYFADGIVEDILSALSRVRWLFVIARQSSFAYRGCAVDVKRISRELGVRYLVEGSVRKSGRRVRISAQLIDTASGAHVWADHYDRNLSDVFEVQDGITREIVGALAPELTAAEINRTRQQHPKSLSAWDAYIRALPLMRDHTKVSNARAVKLLRSAIEKSPDFAAAYARLSACRTQTAYYGWDGFGSDSITEALDLARRSQALDAEEPLAFDALASAYQIRGENEKAVDAARRALELSPTCTAAYGTLVSALAFLGSWETALEAFARSERTSPRDPDRSGRLMGLAIAYFVAGRYEDSINAANEYVGVRPNWYGGYIFLAASHALTGRTHEAQAAAQRVLELIPQFTLSRALKRPMFSRASDSERLFDGLQKAGIPA